MAVARKEQLLDIGARLAARHGLGNVTRRMVAGEAKVSEALVSSYMGDVEQSRAAYKTRARKLGLKLPDAATEAELGLALRAHGPRTNGQKRQLRAKQVKAIKRKQGGAAKKSLAPATVKAKSSASVPPSGTGLRRSAARAPVLPPLVPETSY